MITGDIVKIGTSSGYSRTSNLDGGKTVKTSESASSTKTEESSSVVSSLSSMSASEPFDQSKVDAARAAILEGRLQIDVDKIADSLLENSDKLF